MEWSARKLGVQDEPDISTKAIFEKCLELDRVHGSNFREWCVLDAKRIFVRACLALGITQEELEEVSHIEHFHEYDDID